MTLVEKIAILAAILAGAALVFTLSGCADHDLPRYHILCYSPSGDKLEADTHEEPKLYAGLATFVPIGFTRKVTIQFPCVSVPKMPNAAPPPAQPTPTVTASAPEPMATLTGDGLPMARSGGKR